MNKRKTRILAFAMVLCIILSTAVLSIFVFADDGSESAPQATIEADIPQSEVVIVEQDYEDIDTNTSLTINTSTGKQIDTVYDEDLKSYVADFDYSKITWADVRRGSGYIYNGPDDTTYLPYVPTYADGYTISFHIKNITGYADEYLYLNVYTGETGSSSTRGIRLLTSQFAENIWYKVEIKVSLVNGAKAVSGTKTPLSGEGAGVAVKLGINHKSQALSGSKYNTFMYCLFNTSSASLTDENGVETERGQAHFRMDNVKLTMNAYSAASNTLTITEQDYENPAENSDLTYNSRYSTDVSIVDGGDDYPYGNVADFDYSKIDWDNATNPAYGGGTVYIKESSDTQVEYVPSSADGFDVSFNFRNVTGYNKDILWFCVYSGESGSSAYRGFQVKTSQFETGVWYHVEVNNTNGTYTGTKTVLTGEGKGTTTALKFERTNYAISGSKKNTFGFSFYNASDTGTDANGEPTERRNAHYQIDEIALTTEKYDPITVTLSDQVLKEGYLPLLAAYDTNGVLIAISEGVVKDASTAEFDISKEYDAFSKAASVKVMCWDSYANAKACAIALEVGDLIHPMKVSSETDTDVLSISADMNPSVTDTMSILAYTVSNTYTEKNIPAYTDEFDILYLGQGAEAFSEFAYDKSLYDYTTQDIVVVINNGTTSVVTILEKVTPATHTNIALNLGGNESELNFTWYSLDSADGYIRYAEASRLVNGELPENAISVKAERTVSKKENYYGNKATITGLAPNTVYYYQLVNGDTVTEPRTITTGNTGSFSFALAADPQIGRGYGSDSSLQWDCIDGDGDGWGRTLAQMMSATEFAGVNFLMTAGDLTNGNLYSYLGTETQLDAYLNHDELLSIPQVTVVGNHDVYPYATYQYHFNQPNMLTKADGSYYGASYESYASTNFISADYFFTYNSTLFLVLNTNTFTAKDGSEASRAKDRAAAEEHGEFIERAMELTADLDIKWTIVLYHHAPFSSSYHGNYALNADGTYVRPEQYMYDNIKEFLFPIMYENGVDLVLSGHDHVYTRTHIIKPQQDENGNYTSASVITPYEDGNYVYEDGTTTPKFVSWTDANGVVHTDLKVESQPVKVVNPDGMLHIVAATASGSNVNRAEVESLYTAVNATANTRQLSRIDISDTEITIVTYNLGNASTDTITEIDRFTIVKDPCVNGHSYVEGACEHCGEEEPVLKISAASLTLAEDLSMNFYVNVPSGYDDNKLAMRFTMNGASTTVTEFAVNNGRYVFSFTGIAPQQMGDNIRAELIYDGEVVALKDNYSVKQNVLNIMDDANDSLKTLLVDMLNYGAAAQKYTGYKTSSLVNADIEGGTDVIPTEADNKRSADAPALEGFGFVFAGVRFDFDNKLYVKFVAESTDGLSVRINSDEVEFNRVGNTYIAYSEGISVIEFAEVFTFELVKDGIVIHTVTYSVNSYAYSMADNSEMSELALALYRYGASAMLYKASN